MKTNSPNQMTASEREGSALKNACREWGQRIVSGIKKARAAIFAEAGATLQAPDHLVQLALNEAEAVAAETLYPHLLFPMLALEKVQAVSAWNARQQSIRSANVIEKLAA